MPSDERTRILCVDDEPNVLESLRRSLRRTYDVTVAEGGRAGLEAIEHGAPFAVVTSDLRMPELSGIAFLGRVRDAAPDTVRVLLTGNADLGAAVAAVNEGSIFRFLTKPCPPDVLLPAVAAAVEQHRLVTAERVLLEQTLRGSIQALTDVLALTNPTAFGRATRVRQLVSQLVEQMGIVDGWPIEVAASLSQIGCVTLPSCVADKLYHGRPLEPHEEGMTRRLPDVTERLLANIPRLDQVREILHYQSAPPEPGHTRPLGACLLRLALDWDTLLTQGMETGLALDTLRGREGCYDADALEAMCVLLGTGEERIEIRELELTSCRVGMVLAEDVSTRAGALLIARGQEVTEGLLARVHNFSLQLGAGRRVRVIVPRDADAPADVEEPHGADGLTG